MEKLDGKTYNVVSENVSKLKELFPEVFIEGKIDFEKLQLTLGEHVVKTKERYNFTWNGKTEAIQLAQKQTTRTLRPCKEESFNWDTTENLYIEGDNLEVLRTLQNSYRNKVKMIYIDPPYNTGNDLIYEDNFYDNVKNYKEQMNENMKSNPETSGRFHTKWLNMIYPRLMIAKRLLKSNGVLLISIDDNEFSRLKEIMDEIFVGGHLATFVWRRRIGSSMSSSWISNDHEYVLAYSKNPEAVFIKGEERDMDKYNIPDGEGRFFASMPLTVGMNKSMRPGQWYELKHPVTGKGYYPTEGRVWAYYPPTMEEKIKEGKVLFPDDYPDRNMTTPRLKSYAEDAKRERKPLSTWIIEKKSTNKEEKLEGRYQIDSPKNEEGTRILKNLMGDSSFTYPKPLTLIRNLVDQFTEGNDIVLDFFAGSSTTAHAVLELNSEDQGNRKFIMIQLSETIDRESDIYKEGFENICEIGKERIRRAAKKILEDNNGKEGIEDLDIGFKVFKLDETNLQAWDADATDLEKNLFDMVNPIKAGRTQEDVVYEVLLKYGIDLTVPIQDYKIAGKTIYDVGMGYLLICLDRDLTLELVEMIAKKQPARVVFYDEGFKDDTTRTNAQQILKRHKVEDIRVI